MPLSFLIPSLPRIEPSAPSQISTPTEQKRKEYGAKKWMEHFMVAAYAFTIAFIFTVKVVMEVHILTLHPDDVPIFVQHFAAFYRCLLFGLTPGCFLEFSDQNYKFTVAINDLYCELSTKFLKFKIKKKTFHNNQTLRLRFHIYEEESRLKLSRKLAVP